jgi:hypothetical protein
VYYQSALAMSIPVPEIVREPIPVCPRIYAFLESAVLESATREEHRLPERPLSTEASQFVSDWSECVEIVKQRLLGADPAADPAADPLVFASYQDILRNELNTWFQPEHHRGAWLRALSKARPEAGATLRHHLAEIRLSGQTGTPAPRRWACVLAYAATVAVAAICFGLSPLPVRYRVMGALFTSLFLLAVAIVIWRRARDRRRHQIIGSICKALADEGVRLAAILQEP